MSYPEILYQFSRREFNIPVASHVAEEGLNIQAVDKVVFYEPTPKAIRAIQRRGRTGRSEVGKLVVLITEDSRNEAFLYTEIGREKKMREIVRKIAAIENVQSDGWNIPPKSTIDTPPANPSMKGCQPL